jgi:hypothetical protein
MFVTGDRDRWKRAGCCERKNATDGKRTEAFNTGAIKRDSNLAAPPPRQDPRPHKHSTMMMAQSKHIHTLNLPSLIASTDTV